MLAMGPPWISCRLLLLAHGLPLVLLWISHGTPVDLVRNHIAPMDLPWVFEALRSAGPWPSHGCVVLAHEWSMKRQSWVAHGPPIGLT